MKDNQHKDFDNFFQNKLNDRQFEFKDDFWEEMETLLPKNDTDLTTAGNNRGKLVWGVLLLCLIGFVGWLAYPNTGIRLSANERKNVKTNLENTNANVVDVTPNFDNKNKQLSKNENTKTTLNTNIEGVNEQNVLQENNNLISIQNTNTKTNAFGESQIKVNINIQNQNIDYFIINNKNSIEITKGEIGKEENTNVKTIDSNPLNKSIINNKNSVEITKGEIRKEENTNVKTIDSNPLNNEMDRLTAPLSPIIFNGNNKNKVQEDGNSMENEAAQNAKLLTIKPIALATKMEKRDIQAGKLNCDGCPLKPNFHSLKIGMSAGLSVSQGFKNAMDFRAKPSFDPTIGLRFAYRHSPIADWSINAEILYWSRSSLNAQIGYDSTVYGFGVTTISRTINIEELHYVTMPIYAVYTKKEHQFMGGLTVNYLLNAKSTTEGTVETLKYDATELENEAVTQQWGYTAAFKQIDLGLSLGYDYQVAKGWKVGARINYGLMDVAKNDVFSRQSFDNNLNIRFLLIYDFKELGF